MSLFQISGGLVFDPSNGFDGQVHDLWISNGRIVDPPVNSAIRAGRVLDATG